MSPTGDSMDIQYLGFSEGCIQQVIFTCAGVSARVSKDLGARPVPRSRKGDETDADLTRPGKL